MTVDEFMSPEYQADLKLRMKKSREKAEREQDEYYQQLGESVERHPIVSVGFRRS